MDIGRRLGTVGFNALYGNHLDGLAADAQDDLATENLAFAAAAASTIGGDSLIEPLSGIPAYPLSHAADAIAVCDRVTREYGVDNVKLLADLYHLAINGDDLDAVIGTHAGWIGHVQIADVPGRGEPGTGRLDTARHVPALTDRGYDGWISLEYVPTRPDTFDWVTDFLA